MSEGEGVVNTSRKAAEEYAKLAEEVVEAFEPVLARATLPDEAKAGLLSIAYAHLIEDAARGAVARATHAGSEAPASPLPLSDPMLFHEGHVCGKCTEHTCTETMCDERRLERPPAARP